MLSNTHNLTFMIAVLALAVVAIYVITGIRARQSNQLIFEEEDLPEIVSLKLNQ
jgi:hypothetical protein